MLNQAVGNIDENSTVGKKSPFTPARIAGFGYLMVFILGIFGSFFAFDKLIVAGDAVTTASNIMANMSLFRFGIASWLVVAAFDALVACATPIIWRHLMLPNCKLRQCCS